MIVPDDWEGKRFLDFVELHRGYDLPLQDRQKGEVPIIGSNGIVGYHTQPKLKGPGVITGRSGSIGLSFYIEHAYWPLNTSLYVSDFKENYPLFVYFYFKHFNFDAYSAGVSVPTLNRNLVHESWINVPPFHEQRKITAILLQIQKAIEIQERIIATTRELKKSTMEYVFTYGLRGEKTKETEIGRMPESWEACQIRGLGKIVTGSTPPTKNAEYYQDAKYQFISPIDIGNTTRIYKTEKRISEKGLSISRVLPKNTICFVCIGSTIGKVGITVEDNTATNQQINSIIVHDRFDPFYITYLLDYNSAYIASFSSPSPVPILSKGKFEQINIMLSYDKTEQEEIGKILISIDSKIELAAAKKVVLQDLFKTMLNRLMTGEIRLKDLEIDVSEVA